MKKSTISKQWSYTTDLFSTLAVKSRKLSMLWLMLLTLLLVSTRMVAQTTTEDPRYVLFKGLDGITDVTITDNGDYPWKMLNLNAEGMDNLGFTFPEKSKVLMSNNYYVDKSSSETVVNFKVTKRILLTFKNLVSSDYYDRATVTLDNKEYGNISGKNQIEEVKALLPIGEHSLKLSYKKDRSGSFYADRAFIYDLNTATNISDYVAEFNATNQTLTFKKISSDNLENLDFKNIVIANNEPTVKDVCTRLGIDKRTIKSVIFDKSFNEYALTSLKGFFKECGNLETISGLDYLNTENVTDMSDMFNNCTILPSLDLSNFNTAKVTIMYNMFKNCKKLSSLNLSESFNTVNVTNMSTMFNGCSQLSSLDISNFNTENVTYMYNMFENCNNLSSLDLSNFNTAKVTDMSYMFYGCSTLQTIYVSDNFVVTGITNESFKKNLFTGCEALPEYGDAKTSSDYANYKTGYFTKLVVRNGDERYGIKGETTQLTVDNLVLADNKDLVVFDPFKATTASYNRTINTTWATLCLPFEVSLEGQNFRAFKLLSADDATETVELEELKTIEAGTPVIIKMTNGATELKFTEADKNIAKDVQTAATADGNYQLQGLYTQKEFSKDADNNCYIVKGNKLMNPTKLLENTKVTKVVSKPFRAYMVDNSSSAAGAKMFSIGISDSTTAIDSLNTIANDKAEYYDLQGKRLNEPQKGINIVKRGGKTMKVIIK